MKTNGNRIQWTPISIGSILVGFVVFWPVGLFLLFWVLTGRDVRVLPGIIQEKARRAREWFRQTTSSGNRVFDEYQQTQFDRVDEIKAEIKERENAFRRFKEEQDRAAEQKEFEEFMRHGPANGAQG